MPKEYIERDVLLERFEQYSSGFIVEDDYDTALTIIHGAPIDDELVEVVRCGECNSAIKRTVYDVERTYWCNKHAVCVKPTDYCSYGERKEHNNA